MSVDSKDGGLFEESAERVVDFVRALAVNPTRPHVSESESQKVRDVRKARHQKNEKKRKASSMNSGDNSPPNPRRVKRTTRGASPSHFYVDEAEQNMFDQKTNKEYLQKLPMRHRIDNVLRAVSSMYYNRKQVIDQGKNVIDQATSQNTMPLSTHDAITHPLRKPGVLDNWTPKEIALFECGICSKGKDFYAISKIIETKSTAEVVDFYYDWKKSGHYVMWKYFKRPTEKYPSSRLQQMSAINSKMKGYHKPRPSSSSSSTALTSPNVDEAGATESSQSSSSSSSSSGVGDGNAGSIAEAAFSDKGDTSSVMNDDEPEAAPSADNDKDSDDVAMPLASADESEDKAAAPASAAAPEEDEGEDGGNAMEDEGNAEAQGEGEGDGEAAAAEK